MAKRKKRFTSSHVKLLNAGLQGFMSGILMSQMYDKIACRYIKNQAEDYRISLARKWYY